jgi:elongation factor G
MNGSTPTPVLLLTMHPKSDVHVENLATGLRQLMAEDPTLRVDIDPQSGDPRIAAVGELQLEIVVHRLAREFHVEATVGTPRVAYIEAFTQAADGQGRYARQTGGTGQYGYVKLKVSPAPAGTGYEFSNALIEAAIPDRFVEPIRRGIEDALPFGVFAGYPIRDVRVELYDASYHKTDSSEMAFKIAGVRAFQDAAQNAMPILLEPVMRVEVQVPREHVADVIGSLASRRGVMQAHDDHGETQIVRAVVPASNMFGYGLDLRSRTRGRATYSLHFDHYEPVGPDPDGSNDGRDSLVGAPLKPAPKPNISAVALAEPDDDFEA